MAPGAWRGVVLMVILGSAAVGGDGAGYRSPYRVEFRFPEADLIGDLDGTDRGDPTREATIPHRSWYAAETRGRWRAWGPPARHFGAPAGVDRWPAERRRERAVAVALRYRGYGYQHHHVPDWEPPAGWPWLESCAGRNGKGVDCSNLTGFVYNLGFGLRIDTDVHAQAAQREVAEGTGAGARRVALRVVDLPPAFGDRVAALRTGDLLFVRNRAGAIGHVALWVGPIGRSPDGTPLVIDSHGEDTRDSAGVPIPCGVQLRPFRENSWYNRSASHALRLIEDDPGAGGPVRSPAGAGPPP